MRVSLSLSTRRLMLAVCSVLVVGLLVGVAPGLAVNLPDGRVYEEATPVHMNGARAVPAFVSADGEKVFYVATGAFEGPSGGDAGSPYEAVRRPDGWQSSELLPSAKEYYPYFVLSPILDFSGDLSRSITEFAPPFESGFEPVNGRFYIQESNGNPLEPATTKVVPLTPQSGGYEPGETLIDLHAFLGGDSSDLKHMYFSIGNITQDRGQLLEEDELGTPSQHYKFVGVIGPNNPDGTGTFASQCGAGIGAEGTEEPKHTAFHAVSPDGSIVIFTAHGCFETGPLVKEVMARIDGKETIPISEPTIEYCPGLNGAVNFNCKPATFEGASYNDSKVFFTSTQSEEVPGVTDTTGNIYEAEIGGSTTKSVTKMVQVSAGDSSGEGARVQGVVRISDDGSHVYFVAQGVLTSALGPEGLPAQNGADNLYVSADGTIQFIGELCSGKQVSGSVADPHCPAGDVIWGGEDDHPAWAAPFGSETADGHTLVFDTVAQLITSGPEADTDTATDVYEYDSQTNKLIRASTGRNGFDDNGNSNEFRAFITTPDYGTFGAFGAAENSIYVNNGGQGGRPVSNDGSFIFFQTSEALQSDDVNGAPDTYEWHDGLVSLISDGRNPGTEEVVTNRSANVFLGSSADGRDVFFTTPDTLLPEGGDSPAAIYDARIGGGIPRPIVPPPCREDACQGSLSPTPSFPSPSSALYNSGGNTAIPATSSKPKVKKTTKPKKHAKSKRHTKVTQRQGKRAKSVRKSHTKGRK